MCIFSKPSSDDSRGAQKFFVAKPRRDHGRVCYFTEKYFCVKNHHECRVTNYPSAVEALQAASYSKHHSEPSAHVVLPKTKDIDLAVAGRMLDLDDSHVVKATQIDVTDDGVAFDFEPVEGGRILASVDCACGLCSATYSQRQVAEIAQQLLCAVKNVHDHGMAHLDIRPESILFTQRRCKKSLLKLFVSPATCALCSGLPIEGVPSSPLFSPPETFTSPSFMGEAFDVWQIGTLLYTLSFGHLPFFASSYSDIKALVLSSEPEYPATVDPLFKDFLSRCLSKNPTNRYTLQDLTAHPWLLTAAAELTPTSAVQQLVEHPIKMDSLHRRAAVGLQQFEADECEEGSAAECGDFTAVAARLTCS